jgi:hypothetical protein
LKEKKNNMDTNNEPKERYTHDWLRSSFSSVASKEEEGKWCSLRNLRNLKTFTRISGGKKRRNQRDPALGLSYWTPAVRAITEKDLKAAEERIKQKGVFSQRGHGTSVLTWSEISLECKLQSLWDESEAENEKGELVHHGVLVLVAPPKLLEASPSYGDSRQGACPDKCSLQNGNGLGTRQRHGKVAAFTHKAESGK